MSEPMPPPPKPRPDSKPRPNGKPTGPKAPPRQVDPAVKAYAAEVAARMPRLTREQAAHLVVLFGLNDPARNRAA